MTLAAFAFVVEKKDAPAFLRLGGDEAFQVVVGVGGLVNGVHKLRHCRQFAGGRVPEVHAAHSPQGAREMLDDGAQGEVLQIAELPTQAVRGREGDVHQVRRRAENLAAFEAVDVLQDQAPPVLQQVVILQAARAAVAGRGAGKIARRHQLENARVAVGIGDQAGQVGSPDDEEAVARASQHASAAESCRDRAAQVGGLRAEHKLHHVHVLLEDEQRVLLRQFEDTQGGQAELVASARDVASGASAAIAPEGFAREDRPALFFQRHLAEGDSLACGISRSGSGQGEGTVLIHAERHRRRAREALRAEDGRLVGVRRARAAGQAEVAVAAVGKRNVHREAQVVRVRHERDSATDG